MVGEIDRAFTLYLKIMKELLTTEKDILTVLPDYPAGTVRFTINDLCIVMPHMTAAIVAVEIQQILREIYKAKRKTKRPQ